MPDWLPDSASMTGPVVVVHLQYGRTALLFLAVLGTVWVCCTVLMAEHPVCCTCAESMLTVLPSANVQPELCNLLLGNSSSSRDCIAGSPLARQSGTPTPFLDPSWALPRGCVKHHFFLCQLLPAALVLINVQVGKQRVCVCVCVST